MLDKGLQLDMGIVALFCMYFQGKEGFSQWLNVTCSRLEYSFASMMLKSLEVPYIVAPLRLSLSSLPCKTSLQSGLPAVSAIDLQT